MRLLTSTRSVAISPGATPSAGVPQPSRWRRRTRCELSHACLEERDSSQGRDTGEFARNAIAQVSLAGLSLLAQTYLPWAACYFRRWSSAVSKRAFVRCELGAIIRAKPEGESLSVGAGLRLREGGRRHESAGAGVTYAFGVRPSVVLRFSARNCRAGHALRLHAADSSQTDPAVREHGAAGKRGTQAPDPVAASARHYFGCRADTAHRGDGRAYAGCPHSA